MLTHLGQYAQALQTLQWSGDAMPMIRSRRILLHTRIARALGHRREHSVERALAELDGSDPINQLLVRLEATLGEPADAAAEACAELMDEAERSKHLAIGMRARVRYVRHRTEARGVEAAEVDDLVQRLGRIHPTDTCVPEAWWIAARAFDAVQRTEAADAVLRQGFDWIAVRALPLVPAEFRATFLDRDPVNRDLLATAARRLGLRVSAPAITAR